MKIDPLVESITDGIAEYAAGGVVHDSAYNFRYRLKTIWRPIPVEQDSTLQNEEVTGVLFMRDFGSPAPRRAPSLRPAPPKRPPPWYIGMSSDFTKSISGIDRKLQGRILEAIAKITQEPTIPHGDTIKPLVGELQGCWRYRLGDHRLIYSPDESTGNITLVAFAPRGSVYVD